MDYVDKVMLERHFQPTNNVGDMALNVILLRGVNNEDKPEAFRILMAKRKDWLVWLTFPQREWQRNTKNPNKARHHDSISIREKYVTCGAKGVR